MTSSKRELVTETVTHRLLRLADEHAAAYQSAHPFPHAVIDDLLPADLLAEALRDFPQPSEMCWIEYDRKDERKLAFPSAEKLPATLRNVLYFLNSAAVLEFLERLTGITNLLPDPYFVGGGLHQIERGGFLGVHADFNKYERFALDRRLNLLLYLNQDWPEEFGGHLELWNQDMSVCEKRILPEFNRCVVFSTTDTSYHGHPEPLTCPVGRTRKSIATYYYTNGRPAHEVSDVHSTIFKERPDAQAAPGAARRAVKSVVRALTPPLIADTIYRLRRPGKQ